MLVENSNATIQTSTFSKNIAQYGAAVDLSWSISIYCIYQISLWNFTQNSAVYHGGAIRYNLFRPTFANNVFVNNSAGYGPNIASYPIKIKLRNSSSDNIQLTNVGSGVVYDETLEFALVDYDNQINELDNSSLIIITALSLNTSALGTNFK